VNFPSAEEEKNIKLRAMLEEVSAQKEYGDRVIQDMTNKKKQVELELKHRFVDNQR
jgi:hypothetical protein